MSPQMNRTRLLLTATAIVIAVHLGSVVYAQDLDYPPDATIASYMDEYFEHPSVILDWDKRHRVRSEGRLARIEEKQSSRYLILDDEATAWTNFNLEFPEGTDLLELKLSIRNPNGEVISYGPGQVTITKQRGLTRFRLALANASRGSIVDVYYRVLKPASPFSGSYMELLRFDVPALNVKHAVQIPNVWNYVVKPSNFAHKLEDSFDMETADKMLVYKDTNVAPFADEPLSPDQYEVLDVLEMSFSETEFSHTTVSGIESWDELGREFKRYAIAKDRLFRSPISPTAKTICYGAKTDSAKVANIMAYIGENIKINNRSTNESFASVLKNGSGNIYLVNGLTSTLIAECGVENQFVLAQSTPGLKFDSTFVSPYEFVYPGIRLDGSERSFLFPHLHDFPIGHIPEYYRGSTVMLVDQDGFQGFDTIPEESPFDGPFRYDMTIDIDEDGSVHVDEHSIAEGTTAYWRRQHFQSLDSLQRENYVRSSIEYDYIFDIYDVQVNNVDSIGAPLEVVLKYTMPGQTVVGPDEVVFRTTGIFQPYTRSVFKVDPDKRINPIKIGASSDVVKNIRVTYPESWTLQQVPEDVLLENQFGSASMTYDVSDGELMVRQEISWNRGVFPREDYPQLIDLIGEKSRIYLKSLVFDRGN